MIAANNITLSINTRKLLDGVSLQVHPGLFTAVAGPNGAGKTSLLNVLSGETSKYSGSLEINGVAASRYSVAELSRVRAVLPQNSHMQFPFTVKQVVELGQQYKRKFVTPATLAEVMELTGIEALAGRNFLTLSGGEQQRVQLARVLLQVWEQQGYPRYILLDEPTSSLDLAQQQLIFNLVKKTCERNIGVLAIVHDLNQVAQYADQLYFLKDGKVVAEGETGKVFTKKIIEETFCCRVNVYHDPCTNCPYIIPDKEIIQSPLKTVNL